MPSSDPAGVTAWRIGTFSQAREQILDKVAQACLHNTRRQEDLGHLDQPGLHEMLAQKQKNKKYNPPPQNPPVSAGDDSLPALTCFSSMPENALF